MNATMRRIGLAAALAGGLALASCGGDDFDSSNDTSQVTSSVPDSASQSVSGFIDYLMKLVTASADMLQPVDVSNFTAPVDDTGQPVALP